MKREVRVTDRHIAHGQRKTCCSCPIALALNVEPALKNKSYPQTVDASVHLADGHLTIEEKNEENRITRTLFKFALPLAAQEFVRRYQEGEPVQPFDFTLNLKNCGLRQCQSGTI